MDFFSILPKAFPQIHPVIFEAAFAPEKIQERIDQTAAARRQEQDAGTGAGGSSAPRGMRNQKPQYTAGQGSSVTNYKLDEKQMMLGSMINGGNLSMLLGN